MLKPIKELLAASTLRDGGRERTRNHLTHCASTAIPKDVNSPGTLYKEEFEFIYKHAGRCVLIRQCAVPAKLAPHGNPEKK
jgi:hypothetical protein